MNIKLATPRQDRLAFGHTGRLGRTLALGLALGACASSMASISPGTSPQLDQPKYDANGELAFLVFDNTAKVSYTLDLGLDMAGFRIAGQQDAGSQQFWVVDDAQWVSFLSQTTVANLRWAVLGIDPSGPITAGGQGLFATIKQGDEAKAATFSNQQVTTVVGSAQAGSFYSSVNQTGTHGKAGVAADYTVNGSSVNAEPEPGNAYFGYNGAGLLPIMNGVFDTSNALGQSAWFYNITRSSNQNAGKVNIDEFDNLGHDAYWGFTYVDAAINSPYAGKYLLSYTMEAAGVTAATAAGQQRMSFTDYSAGFLSRALSSPVGEFAGYQVSSLVVPSPVPEPASWGLFATGLLALGLRARQRA